MTGPDGSASKHFTVQFHSFLFFVFPFSERSGETPVVLVLSAIHSFTHSFVQAFIHSFIHSSLYFVCRFNKEWKPSLKLSFLNDIGNQVVDSITFAFIHLIIRSFLPANSFYERQTADIKKKCRWRMVDSILLSFIHLFFYFVPPSAGSIKYEKRGENEKQTKNNNLVVEWWMPFTIQSSFQSVLCLVSKFDERREANAKKERRYYRKVY